jgi:hypothetical protein
MERENKDALPGIYSIFPIDSALSLKGSTARAVSVLCLFLKRKYFG